MRNAICIQAFFTVGRCVGFTSVQPTRLARGVVVLRSDLSVFLIKVYPTALNLFNHSRIINLMKNG